MKEENYPTGAFVAFVLLSQNEWDHYCPVKAGKSVFEIVET